MRLRLPAAIRRRAAPAERRVVITDDFGQRVEMSADQFADLVEEAKAGKLDAVAAV